MLAPRSPPRLVGALKPDAALNSSFGVKPRSGRPHFFTRRPGRAVLCPSRAAAAGGDSRGRNQVSGERGDPARPFLEGDAAATPTDSLPGVEGELRGKDTPPTRSLQKWGPGTRGASALRLSWAQLQSFGLLLRSPDGPSRAGRGRSPGRAESRLA